MPYNFSTLAYGPKGLMFSYLNVKELANLSVCSRQNQQETEHWYFGQLLRKNPYLKRTNPELLEVRSSVKKTHECMEQQEAHWKDYKNDFQENINEYAKARLNEIIDKIMIDDYLSMNALTEENTVLVLKERMKKAPDLLALFQDEEVVNEIKLLMEVIREPESMLDISDKVIDNAEKVQEVLMETKEELSTLDEIRIGKFERILDLPDTDNRFTLLVFGLSHGYYELRGAVEASPFNIYPKDDEDCVGDFPSYGIYSACKKAYQYGYRPVVERFLSELKDVEEINEEAKNELPCLK